jgi:hypothetical protein
LIVVLTMMMPTIGLMILTRLRGTRSCAEPPASSRSGACTPTIPKNLPVPLFAVSQLQQLSYQKPAAISRW